MDGVVVDTERTWRQYGNNFLASLVGKDIAEKVGDIIGITLTMTYNRAVQHGYTMEKTQFVRLYDQKAEEIYAKAAITPGVDTLATKLLELGFRLALVSSSGRNWINFVLPRISFSDKLDSIISLNDQTDLQPKPSPSGYLEAIKQLEATPQTTIILEDSNKGIQAAKAAGAYVIGFRQNLVPEYKQEGADVYADTMGDVIKIVESL